MAEAAAVIGLVSSIASLVDLSAEIVSRLHEFIYKASDVPESFRSLSTRLHLLTAALRRIDAQAQAGRLSDETARALPAVVDSTSAQVSVVRARLCGILPPENASKVERALKALRSLAKEDKVCQAPHIDPDAFIGQTFELQQLRDILSPIEHAQRRRVLCVSGMGGMGNRQLSVAHVRDCADDYSSVYWVNAKDEITLR